MKRLLIIFLLMAALLLLLAACDSGAPADTTTEDTTIAAEVTDAPAETPAETPTEAPTEPETEEETTVKVIYETIQNPVAPTGADPWVVRHGDKYYYCYSSPVWFFGGVGVNEISSIDKVILLACHNGICRTAHSYFSDMTNEEFMSYVVKNAAVSIYEF